jgi:hypothetical protein
MTNDELASLAKFVADPAPEPTPRQFEPFYSEVLNLVRLLMIPAGCCHMRSSIPDPSRFQLNTIFYTPTGCPARRR